jgi:hypothetical protein
MRKILATLLALKILIMDMVANVCRETSLVAEGHGTFSALKWFEARVVGPHVCREARLVSVGERPEDSERGKTLWEQTNSGSSCD